MRKTLAWSLPSGCSLPNSREVFSFPVHICKLKLVSSYALHSLLGVDWCVTCFLISFFHLWLLLAPRRPTVPFRNEREHHPCNSWGICGTWRGRLGALGFLLVNAALLDVLNIRYVNSLLEGSTSSTEYARDLGRQRLASVLKQTYIPPGNGFLVLVTLSKQH